jgi:DNA-binding NtrC family response regulator
MNPIPFGSSGGGSSSPTALVIEPILPHLLAVLSTLSSMGFDTTVAETFQDARAALSTHPPTLLVTGIKLREYNGLHLVLRGMTSWPDLAAIVTSEAPDSLLQEETERLGATFVVMPAPQMELVAAVSRTVLRARRAGGPLEPIRPPFERRLKSPASLTVVEPQTAERRRDAVAAIRALAGH